MRATRIDGQRIIFGLYIECRSVEEAEKMVAETRRIADSMGRMSWRIESLASVLSVAQHNVSGT